MQIDLELLNKIYKKLGDEISKEIFAARLMFSMTDDWKWIHDIRKFMKYDEGGALYDKMEQCALDGEMVIFGACWLGWCLYRTKTTYPWKCFVDNYREASSYAGLPLLNGCDFLKQYHGEKVFIAAKVSCEEIYNQLVEAGVPSENIINIGEMAKDLMKATYFDLEYMQPSNNKEIFVDAGGYDGMSSVYFAKWCNSDCFTYVFEPDERNIKKCENNLKKRDISYQIINKGLWNEDAVLRFHYAGESSEINNMGEESISVTTLDKALKGKKITFIKMDIEGAECNALLGAKQTIKNNNPKLAISVYHKPEDIWEIPSIVLEYNPSYKLYLRHYTLEQCDTVLYAIPGPEENDN